MTDCVYCKALEKGVESVYEDELVVALLPNKPWVAGHVVLLPKVHVPILEQVPKKTMEHLFVVANKISVASFQATQAHGVNIVVNNGVAAGQRFAHVLMHIVPRMDGDAIDFRWVAKDVPSGVLDGVQERLSAVLMGAEPEHPDQWIIDQLWRIP